MRQEKSTANYDPYGIAKIIYEDFRYKYDDSKEKVFGELIIVQKVAGSKIDVVIEYEVLFEYVRKSASAMYVKAIDVEVTTFVNEEEIKIGFSESDISNHLKQLIYDL